MIDITSWLLAALALVGLGSFVVVFQERFIYFPVRYSAAQLEEARTLGAQEIRFRTSQGSQVAFFCLASETVPERLWLVFGGNGDLALGWLGLVRSVSGSRNAFLLIDYPGYGTCEGRPNPKTILENSERALQALLEQKHWTLNAHTLCVLGHSLGGAAALQFAAKHAVSKILVVSAFTSMDDMVRAQIHIPMGRLLRHRFDNIVALKTILAQQEVPEIDVLHGQADNIIPLRMGRALAALDRSHIKFVEVPGAGHNDIAEAILSTASF